MVQTIIHFLLDNGIGQNVTAGAILAPVGALWARRELVKHHVKIADEVRRLVHSDHPGPDPAESPSS